VKLTAQSNDLNPTPDLQSQLALIASTLAQYNNTMDAALNDLRAQQAKVMNEARAQASVKAEQQYRAEIDREVSEVRKEVTAHAITGIDAAAIPIGARIAPPAKIDLPSVVPTTEYTDAAAAVQSRLKENRQEWEAYILGQTRQAAERWATRHGYVLAPSPTGVEDMAEAFVKQWTH
jgi:hypothetical protein